jgi:hypothetical protein
VGVRIRVAADLSQRINRVLGLAVITENPITLMYLLELPKSVWFAPGMAPHLLPFDEKSVPVIDPGIHGQYPASWG